MGNDIEGGVDFADGELVTAARLDAHVQDATIKPTFISTKALKEAITNTESLVIEDGGTLKRATIQQILDNVGDQFPVGGVVDYAGSVAPTGWLLCYGQEVDRETYADLFEAIGTTHGVGNGSTTFNLPDYRGYVSAGVGNMGGVESSRLNLYVTSALGAAGGVQNYQLVEAHMPSHYHSGSAPDHLHYMHNHQHTVPCQNAGPEWGLTWNAGTANTGLALLQGNSWSGGPNLPYTAGADRSLAFNTDWKGGSVAHINVQPTIAMNKIIKV